MGTLRSNMKKYRIEKNLSQKELAERTGLSLRCIQYCEMLVTIPTITNAYKISECLGLTIEQVFPYEETEVL